MEVSVGVLDYQGETIVLGITEIIPEKNFSITKLNTKVLHKKLPARLDDETREKVEKSQNMPIILLGMSGFSRSEFIIMNGTPYMLEMNTNPGFSPGFNITSTSQNLRNFH